MLPIKVGLLCAASVGIHVEEVTRTSDDVVQNVTERVRVAIEARTKSRAIIDLERSACDKPDRCFEEIHSRTAVTNVVMLTFLGGLSKHKVVAERVRNGRSVARSEITGGPGTPPWDVLAERLVASLFPERAPPIDLVVAPSSPKIVTSNTLTWVLLGVGGTAIIAGGVFAASGLQAQGALVERRIVDESWHDLRSRGRSHTGAAIVLGSVAFVSIVAGLVYDTIQADEPKVASPVR